MNSTILGVLIALAAADPALAAPEAPVVPEGGAAQAAVPGRAAPLPADPELTLDEALALLDRQSPSLAQARARADEAGGIVRQAASGVLPTVSAQGTYLQNNEGARITPPGGSAPLVIQPKESWTATGSARVPLVVPTAWFDLFQARDSARAAAASADATRLALRTGLAQSAYGAVAAEEAVAATEKAVASAEELARSAQRRVAAGTAAPLDVLKARTEAVRRESDLAGARAALARARLALGVLLGRQAAVRVLVPEIPREAPPELQADPQELAVAALAARPEIAAQRRLVQAAEEGLRSAWSRLLPQLSASASAFRSDVPYVTGSRDGWRLTVDLTWAAYDGGYRYGKRRQAEAQVAGARAAEEAQRLTVVQEVQDARRDVDVARERLRLAETQAQLADDAAASAQRSFDAGVASSLDVIDANDRLFQADIGLADARARLAQARLALDRAMGRGR